MVEQLKVSNSFITKQEHCTYVDCFKCPDVCTTGWIGFLLVHFNMGLQSFLCCCYSTYVPIYPPPPSSFQLVCNALWDHTKGKGSGEGLYFSQQGCRGVRAHHCKWAVSVPSNSWHQTQTCRLRPSQIRKVYSVSTWHDIWHIHEVRTYVGTMFSIRSLVILANMHMLLLLAIPFIHPNSLIPFAHANHNRVEPGLTRSHRPLNLGSILLTSRVEPRLQSVKVGNEVWKWVTKCKSGLPVYSQSQFPLTPIPSKFTPKCTVLCCKYAVDSCRDLDSKRSSHILACAVLWQRASQAMSIVRRKCWRTLHLIRSHMLREKNDKMEDPDSKCHLFAL